MKKILLLLTVAAFITACNSDKNKEKEPYTQAENTEIPVIDIGNFDSDAANYVSKEVSVQGIVDHVCKHGGKKILLVTDNGKVHITSEERFDEKLVGSEITLNGIVVEERIDEATCLQMEEDNIKSHSEGKSSQEQFDAKKEHIKKYRDQMKAENLEYISNYSLSYLSHSEIK